MDCLAGPSHHAVVEKQGRRLIILKVAVDYLGANRQCEQMGGRLAVNLTAEERTALTLPNSKREFFHIKSVWMYVLHYTYISSHRLSLSLTYSL